MASSLTGSLRTSELGDSSMSDLVPSQASAGHHNKVGMNLVGALAAEDTHDESASLKLFALLAGHSPSTYHRLVEIYRQPHPTQASRASAAEEMAKVVTEAPAPEGGRRPFNPETDLDRLDAGGASGEKIRQFAKEHPEAWCVNVATGKAELQTQVQQGGLGDTLLGLVLAYFLFWLFLNFVSWVVTPTNAAPIPDPSQ